MVIYAKRDALPVVTCYHFETGMAHEVPLPEQFCTIGAGVNLVRLPFVFLYVDYNSSRIFSHTNIALFLHSC